MKKLMLVLFLCMCSCATYKITTHVDKFSDMQIISMENNRLDNNVFWGYPKVDLNLRKIINKSGISYSINIDYVDTQWLFISSGKSLMLEVDGEKKYFSGPGSSRSRTVRSGDEIAEHAFYSATKKDFLELAQAKKIDVFISGKYVCECSCTSGNLENIKEFVEKHIK